MPFGVISRMPSVTSCTLSRFSVRAHTPLSRSIRFAPGGYVGTTVLEQVGPVGELGAEVPGEHHAHEVVHRARRPRPSAPSRGRRARRRARRRPSARRSRTGSTRCTTARARTATAGPARPRRGSRGSDRTTAACAGTRASSPTIGRDLGDELHRARAGADDRDALARAGRPSWSQRAEWNAGPANESRPGDVGERRPVQLADRADDRVRRRSSPRRRRRSRTRTSTRRSSSDQSAATTSVAKRMCSRSPNASAQRREVVEQHVLGREVQRPVVPLRERVAVVVVRVVDAAAGIRVLEPRAADVVVLLEDDERRRRPAAGGARRAAPTCPRR